MLESSLGLLGTFTITSKSESSWLCRGGAAGQGAKKQLDNLENLKIGSFKTLYKVIYIIVIAVIVT